MSIGRLLVPNLVDLLRQGYGSNALKNDLFGGITAAVVALPLALAFGVASGAGPIAGLYGAIATGFFAALFGGTPSQISGPTGPMTVVMGAVVAAHSSNLSEAFMIVALGGVLQMLFGLARVGSYVAYTPASVISGFMTGVGVIIMVMQSLPAIGLPSAANGVLGTLGSWKDLVPGDVNTGALVLAAGSLLLLVFWPARIAKAIPAPLGVLVIATVATTFVPTQLPIIGPVPSGLPQLHLAAPSLDLFVVALQPAFMLALLGSIDSLLTSLVADSATKTQHDSDKELVGQGIGNFVAGLIGGIPGAGATMRTVVNIRSGGRSAVSGMIHAVVLLAVALGLGSVVAMVPTSALAAILIKVGWDIIDWRYLRRIGRLPREKVAIMLVTFVLTVFVDLITAVAVGIIMAGFVNSRWLAQEQLKGLQQSANIEELDTLSAEEKDLLRIAGGRVLLTILHGSFSYASARELALRDIQAIGGPEVVIYDFTHASYIDPSAALAIDDMIDLSVRLGRHVILSSIPKQAVKALDGMGVLDRVPPQQRFENRHAAIEGAVEYCRSKDA